MNSTYSNAEGSDGICFSSIQWEMDGQSYVGDGAGLSSVGAPINLPDDSDRPTCLFLHPHLTPLAPTHPFCPSHTALCSVLPIPRLLYLYHCPNWLPYTSLLCLVKSYLSFIWIKRDNIRPRDLGESKEVIHIVFLEQHLACCKHSIHFSYCHYSSF